MLAREQRMSGASGCRQSSAVGGTWVAWRWAACATYEQAPQVKTKTHARQLPRRVLRVYGMHLPTYPPTSTCEWGRTHLVPEAVLVQAPHHDPLERVQGQVEERRPDPGDDCVAATRGRGRGKLFIIFIY